MGDRTGGVSNRCSTELDDRTEARVAEIWAEVLGVEQVGADANFFELGGHSLLAGEVVSTLGREFDVALPLRALFAGPTARQLARAIQEAREDGGGETPIPRAQRTRLSDLSNGS
jgi:acyl carrier protein